MTELSEEMRQALKELIESGDLVAIEEIDPKTRTVRTRYYHRDFAPEPS